MLRFILLWAYQESGDADQLQLRSANLLLLQIAIDNINSHVKTLRNHLELQVNFDLKISLKCQLGLERKWLR